MAYNYMIPSVSSLVPGYDATVLAPIAKLGRYLIRDNISIRHAIAVYREGEKVDAQETVYRFAAGKLQGPRPETYVWRDSPPNTPGYLESGFRSADDLPCFKTNAVVPYYTIYSKANRKSFFSDNAYLYASPPVIAQIAEYGQYIDGYPSVRLDRDRDYGESILFINPYRKPLKARIFTADGRAIPNVRVPPMSARRADLDQLLEPGESAWAGQIQITATNRVITFAIKHSLANPTIISDHEHLDPYRGEPTHFPGFQWLRLKTGQWLARHGIQTR